MNRRLERLLCCIPDGKGLIDVGTDHGYLPVELARRGYRGQLFASDINPEPLNAAKRSAERAGLAERIQFIRCDGLSLCDPDAVDTVVIAGMGGDLICRILDQAEWTMDSRYTLLLQPMTKAEVLRYWLSNNDYGIEEEKLVLDGGKLYQLLIVRFGRARHLSDAELFTGSLTLVRDDPLFPRLLNTQIERISGQLLGMEQGRDKTPSGRYALLRGILQDLEEMKKDANRTGTLSVSL